MSDADEVARLRALLGPDEESYEDVRRQRDTATARCRELEHELGALRGSVKRLEQMMWRRTARRAKVAGLARRIVRRVRPPAGEP
jgi:predicted  nucleic acid-binding Zn-ribbon protein